MKESLNWDTELDNELKKRFYWSLNILWETLFFLTFLFFIIFLNKHYQASFIEKAPRVIYVLWIIIESLFLLVLVLLFVVSQESLLYEFSSWKEKLFFAILTINPLRFVYVLVKAKKLGFLHWKRKRWRTIDFSLMAMSIATYLLIAFICKQLLPALPPLFVSLSFEYVSLFFLAYLTGSFLKTLLTSTICGLTLLILPTTYFVNFLQYFFDYLLPVMSVSLSTLVFFNFNEKNKVSKFFTFLTIPYFVIYFSRVLAGVVFYKAFAYPGFPILLYSLIINGLNTGFDYITILLVTPVILSRITNLRTRYQNLVAK